MEFEINLRHFKAFKGEASHFPDGFIKGTIRVNLDDKQLTEEEIARELDGHMRIGPVVANTIAKVLESKGLRVLADSSSSLRGNDPRVTDKELMKILTRYRGIGKGKANKMIKALRSRNIRMTHEEKKG